MLFLKYFMLLQQEQSGLGYVYNFNGGLLLAIREMELFLDAVYPEHREGMIAHIWEIYW